MGLNSMTGYGHGQSAGTDVTYQCEIRSLNSRFLEVNARLPRATLALETEVIGLVKSELARGKVDVFLDLNYQSAAETLPALDPIAAQHYAQLCRSLDNTVSLTTPNAADFLRLEGVLTNATQRRPKGREAIELHGPGVLAATRAAIDELKGARAREGAQLQIALQDLLSLVSSHTETLLKMRTSVLATLHDNYKKKLQSVIDDLQQQGLTEIPDDRTLLESAILIDKADVEEELTRLGTHCQEFQKLLSQQGPAGRKLDFLCQEMHREVNTIANKLSHAEVAKTTLDLKQNIERIRQQVQNIE